MTRQVVIHVGTMKTGTSTLQATFNQNQALLQNHGWRYAGWPMRQSTRIKQVIAVSPDDRLLISDEGLWHFRDSKRSDTPRIARLFADWQVTIVVYLRPPDKYIESWFGQGVKTGTGALSLSAFFGSNGVNSKPFTGNAWNPNAGELTDEAIQHLDLRLLETLRRFTELFPHAFMTIRPYEFSQLRDGDILADFLHYTGLDAAMSPYEFDHVDRQNVSRSANASLLSAILRSRSELPEDLLQMLIADHVASVDESARADRILTARECDLIHASTRPIYEQIVDEFEVNDVPSGLFEDWNVDHDAHRVSPLRFAYNELVERSHANSTDASRPGFLRGS